MKKCTLCVDRIYNETLARGRARAGLRARPARRGRAISAILRDPESEVSQLVAAARRRRPARGPRLSADQQVSAAAPGDDPGRAARAAARRAWASARALLARSTGRSADETGSLGPAAHHVDRLRLTGCSPGSAPYAAWAPARDAVARRSRLGAGLARLRRARGIDASSGPAGARVARLQPVALILAFPRRCVRGPHHPLASCFAVALHVGHGGIPVRLLGAAGWLASARTVLCTAMIYAS